SCRAISANVHATGCATGVTRSTGTAIRWRIRSVRRKSPTWRISSATVSNNDRAWPTTPAAATDRLLREMKMPSAKILEEKGVLRMHRRETLGAMFLAGFICFAQTVAGQTQTPAPSNSSTLPPSASKAVMVSEGGLAAEDRRDWADFLKLADKPNAVFTLQDVEAAFGEKLVTGEPKYMAYYKLGSFLRYQAVDDPSYGAKYPGRRKDSITLLLREKDARTCLPRSKITRICKKLVGNSSHTMPPCRRLDRQEIAQRMAFVQP